MNSLNSDVQRAGFLRSVLAIGFIAMLATPAIAAEVLVKNDIFDLDFSGSVLIGDFAIGDQAGVRLTSPCDGNIVAVQVPWISLSPATPQSLQEAIFVFDGPGFPTPGTELLFLEAPLLSPNAVNEFRFVDENNTIPISVPVSAGQQFYVTLEFGEPTDIVAGSASIVRDQAGCSANTNVIFDAFWFDFCPFQILGTPGDTALRAVVDCEEPGGACCDFNGLCEGDVSEGDCEDPGDTFFQGDSCGEVSCPAPVGACCDGSGGCLANQTQDFCENTLGRFYGGNGSLCDGTVCNPGACCMQDGTCQELIGQVCSTMNPTNFEGPGTTCAAANCSQPLGACCVDVGGGSFVCVPDQTLSNCSGGGDVWQGPLTSCTPDPCSCALPGDMDDDTDIDLSDLDIFTQCFGADVTAQTECLCANVDSSDNTIDLDDWASLANLITGP